MYIDDFRLGFNAGARPLSQLNRDVDLDGTVDIALQATFSIGSAGATNYEFELSRSTTEGGTYTVIETKTSPSGKAWFEANTQYYYKTRVRALSFNGTPGSWSSLSSAVKPAGVTGAPADPTGVDLVDEYLGFRATWDAPTELDYDYTEIAMGTSSAPFTSVTLTASSQGVRFLHPTTIPLYAWVRHFNTSGLSSNWVRSTTSEQNLPLLTDFIGDNQITRAKLNAGAAGAIAINNLGTSGSGSVNAGSATATLLTVTFKATSNTAGVTINLGGYSVTVDLVNNQPYTFTTVENGGGSFSFSKTGGGTIANCQLTATGIY